MPSRLYSLATPFKKNAPISRLRQKRVADPGWKRFGDSYFLRHYRTPACRSTDELNSAGSDHGDLGDTFFRRKFPAERSVREPFAGDARVCPDDGAIPFMPPE